MFPWSAYMFVTWFGSLRRECRALPYALTGQTAKLGGAPVSHNSRVRSLSRPAISCSVAGWTFSSPNIPAALTATMTVVLLTYTNPAGVVTRQVHRSVVALI